MNNISAHKNHIVEIKIRGRKEKIRGILKEVGREWALLEYNPVDYILDGVIIVNMKHILHASRSTEEEFIEEVLKANDFEKFNNRHALDVDHTARLFEKLKTMEAIQVELKDESIIYIGKVEKVYDKSFRMKRVTPRGDWTDEISYNFKSIRIIQIETHYSRSLLTYVKFKNQI
jgi:hypothetical protein